MIWMVELICNWSGHRQSNHFNEILMSISFMFIFFIWNIYIYYKYNSLSVLFRFVTIFFVCFSSRRFSFFPFGCYPFSIADTVINFIFLQLSCNFCVHFLCAWLNKWWCEYFVLLCIQLFNGSKALLRLTINQKFVYFCKLCLNLNSNRNWFSFNIISASQCVAHCLHIGAVYMQWMCICWKR